MKILVRKEDDETETEFEVSVDEQTVKDLKELIASNNFGPAVDEQQLEYGGRRLRNNELLSSYAIEEGSVILLRQNIDGEGSADENTAEEDAGGETAVQAEEASESTETNEPTE